MQARELRVPLMAIRRADSTIEELGPRWPGPHQNQLAELEASLALVTQEVAALRRRLIQAEQSAVRSASRTSAELAVVRGELETVKTSLATSAGAPTQMPRRTRPPVLATTPAPLQLVPAGRSDPGFDEIPFAEEEWFQHGISSISVYGTSVLRWGRRHAQGLLRWALLVLSASLSATVVGLLLRPSAQAQTVPLVQAVLPGPQGPLEPAATPPDLPLHTPAAPVAPVSPVPAAPAAPLEPLAGTGATRGSGGDLRGATGSRAYRYRSR